MSWLLQLIILWPILYVISAKNITFSSVEDTPSAGSNQTDAITADRESTVAESEAAFERARLNIYPPTSPEALPILAEFKVPSLDELDVNEVIASYSEGKPKIDPETGAEELKKYKKGLFILTDSEHKLLYQYYNTSLVESVTESRIADDVSFIESISNTIILESSKKIIFLDAETFEEDVLNSATPWIVVFAKEMKDEEVTFDQKRSIALLGYDLSSHDVKTGFIQCDTFHVFCANLHHGISVIAYPSNVKYHGPLDYQKLLTFGLLQNSKFKFHVASTVDELETIAKRDNTLIMSCKGCAAIDDLRMLDLAARVNSGFNLVKMDCGTSDCPEGPGIRVLAKINPTEKMTGVGTMIETIENIKYMNWNEDISEWFSLNGIMDKRLVMTEQQFKKLQNSTITEPIVVFNVLFPETLLRTMKFFDKVNTKKYLTILGQDEIYKGDSDTSSMHLLLPGRPIFNFSSSYPIMDDFEFVSFLNKALKNPQLEFTAYKQGPLTGLEPDTLLLNVTMMGFDRYEKLAKYFIELGDVISKLGDENPDVRIAVYIEEVTESSISVVKNGMTFPYIAGHLDSKEIMTFIKSVGDLNVLSSVEDCIFEKLDVRQSQANAVFSMGQIGFNSLDTILLVQVIKFNNHLKSQGRELCFAKGDKTSLMKGSENIEEFAGVPTVDNLKRWVKEGRKVLQTKAPWDILETSQEGSAIVLLYRQDVEKGLLATLETVNNALEQYELVQLDCARFKSFCRKMQGGKKLPLLVILEQTKHSIITLTNMNAFQLTELLNEQSDIASHPEDEGETNDFVLQAPDNMYNDEPFNPVTSSTDFHDDIEAILPTEIPSEEGPEPVVPADGQDDVSVPEIDRTYNIIEDGVPSETVSRKDEL